MLLLSLALAAQAGAGPITPLATPVFEHFRNADGLPGSVVTAIVKDRLGYLWIGTGAGLARWDGYRFKIYQSDSDQTRPFPDSYVQALHVDARGTLWVGTMNKGLVRYEPGQDGFVSIGPGPDGVSHPHVMGMADDGERGLWIATLGGLDYLDYRSGQLRPQALTADASAAETRVQAICRSRDGSLWAGTSAGLFRRPPQASAFTRVALPAKSTRAPSVTALLLSADGYLWIGTQNAGAFRLDPLNDAARAIARTDTDLAAGRDGAIHSLAQTRQGDIWMATPNLGVLVADSGGNFLRQIQHDPAVSVSLADDNVRTLYADDAGLLWLGTSRGLERHQPDAHGILSIFRGMHGRPGLSGPHVTAVSRAPDGQIWLGLVRGGIDIIDASLGSVRNLRPSAHSSAANLSLETVLSIAHTRSGNVYIGTNRSLYRSDATGRNMAAVPTGPRAALVSSAALAADAGGVWIGGREDGVWRLDDRPDAQISRASFNTKLPDRRVNTLLLDGEQLWVGTRQGLFRVQLPDGRVSAVPLEAGPAGSARPAFISHLLRDQRGRIWVATLGAGIARIDGSRVQTLSKRQGLPHNNVDALALDRRGHVWASTDLGLADIDADSMQTRVFQTPQGLALLSYWIGASTTTASGDLLFGAAGGLTLVRPDLLRPWEFQAPMVVTEVRVDGKPVLSAPQLGQPLAAARLRLAPGSDNVAIDFAALDLSAPERIRYAYRLTPYDEEWTAGDATRRTATYTHLPPGDYLLQVRGSNRDGQWSERDLFVPLSVMPAWYQTWWWYTLLILAVCGAIAGLWRTRLALLRQRERALEREVAQRTADLHTQQQALLASNASLNQANTELATSAETLRELGSIGRSITTHLDSALVFQALYEHVQALLAAPYFAIYRVQAERQELVLEFGRIHGAPMRECAVRLSDPHDNIAACARQRQPLWFGLDSAAEDQTAMHTAACCPLLAGDQLLGVMEIESEAVQAFGERERQIFATLSAYGAIALANANAMSALRSAQSKLVQQEKLSAMSNLVVGVAHELNTPLGIVIGAVSGLHDAQGRLRALLEGAAQRSPRLQTLLSDGDDYARLAQDATARMNALIAALKSVLVPAQQQRRDVHDLVPFLSDLGQVWQHELASEHISLELKLPPHMFAEFDPAALADVLQKIVQNCRDHAFGASPPGSACVSVHAYSLRSRNCIRIEDNGQGIPEALLPRIFDPFFTTRIGTGRHLGLGLHVAYVQVTQNLGGSLEVQSLPGQGTRVFLAW